MKLKIYLYINLYDHKYFKYLKCKDKLFLKYSQYFLEYTSKTKHVRYLIQSFARTTSFHEISPCAHEKLEHPTNRL